MSGIGAIQALSPAETWEAWQALVQASLGEGGAEGGHAAEAGEAHVPSPLQGLAQTQAADAPHAVVAASLSAEAQAIQVPNALQPTQQPSQGLLSGHPAHAAHHAHTAQATQPAAEVQAQAQVQAQANRDAPPVNAAPPTALADRAQAAAPSPVQAPAAGLFGDTPMAAARFADAAGAVLPMAPVLMTPLTLQNGPELRWRVQDAASWRALFDDADGDAPQDDAESEPPALPSPDAVAVEALPDWAHLLLARLRGAAVAPGSAAAVRPTLQAWRVGLPVLLASPAGLASLQPSRDAAVWRWRRWPARWRSARPTMAERWWAVRVGLGAQGRPRTVRELAGTPSLPPGQVSCELRLGDVAPGIAQWTEVLVHTPASPSLRALLGARPSLTWLLCNQPLWPQEGP